MNAPALDYIIVAPRMKANALHDHRGRFASNNSGDHVNVNDSEHLAMASQESFGSRVLNFSSGEGSVLDKNVRFATNTNKDGKFERGALRVEIFDPSTQKRNVYQRSMSELPKLIGKVLQKKYAPTSQHRRNTSYVMKADVRRILPNPMHTATPQEVERCKRVLASIPETVLKRAKTQTVSLDDLISIQPTIDEDKVSQMVQAGLQKLQSAPSGLGLGWGGKIYLVDGNHRAIAFQRLGKTEMSLRVVASDTMKAEGHWVTLPTGARIQIHGSAGGAQTQPQEQPQTQSRTVQPDESSGNAGEGLTHAQRTQIVNKIAEKLGIASDSIQVAKEDREDENGKVAGDYDPATKKITVYPEGFSKGKDELSGTLSHESMHAKLDTVLGKYNEQMKAFQDGTALNSGKVDVYKELKPVFAQENRITYQNANGQTKYDTKFWERYKQEPSTQHYTDAVNETLAEVNRLHSTGQSDKVNPQWNRLWRNVNNFAKGM